MKKWVWIITIILLILVLIYPLKTFVIFPYKEYKIEPIGGFWNPSGDKFIHGFHVDKEEIAGFFPFCFGDCMYLQGPHYAQYYVYDVKNNKNTPLYKFDLKKEWGYGEMGFGELFGGNILAYPQRGLGWINNEEFLLRKLLRRHVDMDGGKIINYYDYYSINIKTKQITKRKDLKTAFNDIEYVYSIRQIKKSYKESLDTGIAKYGTDAAERMYNDNTNKPYNWGIADINDGFIVCNGTGLVSTSQTEAVLTDNDFNIVRTLDTDKKVCRDIYHFFTRFNGRKTISSSDDNKVSLLVFSAGSIDSTIKSHQNQILGIVDFNDGQLTGTAQSYDILESYINSGEIVSPAVEDIKVISTTEGSKSLFFFKGFIDIPENP